MHNGLKDKKPTKKGAEASLFLEKWHGRKVIMKRRFPKKYRLAEIDRKIRIYRTIHEAQLLHYAKEAGVPTPTVFMVDLADSNIIMESVEGKPMKQVLGDLHFEERRNLSRQIGELIGRLHRNDIIHGDLTTSNMILTPNGKVVFVDFGLGEKSVELEQRGVDIHLLKRAFQSIHFRIAKECFSAVLEGYAKVLGEEATKKVLGKVREIEKRGRYISEKRKTEE